MKSRERPSKEELEKLYVNLRLDGKEIGRRYHVTSTTVYSWLEEYGVQRRNVSERNVLRHNKDHPSREELEGLYLIDGLSTRQIAERYRVNKTTISKWMKTHGIKPRQDKKLPDDFKKPSKDELERLYLEGRLSSNQIAGKYRVSAQTVCNWLKSEEIPLRPTRSLSENVKKPSREELGTMYISERLSTRQIAERLGVHPATIGRWLKEERISRRSRSEAVTFWHGKKRPRKEELNNMYIEQGLSAIQIAEMLGVSRSTIGNWLSEYGIQREMGDQSESLLESYVGGKPHE